MSESNQFEIWLRTECFQKPTPEAYDLTKVAWNKQEKDKAELVKGLQDMIDIARTPRRDWDKYLMSKFESTKALIAKYSKE